MLLLWCTLILQMLFLWVHPVFSLSTLNTHTCFITKRISTHMKRWEDGNTHLEGNIIILVNRSASLQHIFRGPVFSLFVRQRCLSWRHRNAREKADRAEPLFPPRGVQERRARCPRDLRRSVPLSASLQPRRRCSHHCAWLHEMITGRFCTSQITPRGEQLWERYRKRRWKLEEESASGERWCQTGGNLGVIVQSGAVHPGVGRSLTECSAALTALCSVLSQAVCEADCPQTAAGSHAPVVEADSSATGGARSGRGSERRAGRWRPNEGNRGLNYDPLIWDHFIIDKS